MWRLTVDRFCSEWAVRLVRTFESWSTMWERCWRLERTCESFGGAGPFTEEGNFTMYDILRLSQAGPDEKEEITRKIVRPMEAAFELVPKVVVRDSAVSAVCHGADLAVPGVVRLGDSIRPGGSIALFTLKGELVALSKALMSSEQVMKEEHGLVAKTVRVVMPPETYPRMWKSRVAKEVPAQS